jgi:maltooligosyltrehalose trehalohydrolase
MMKTNTHSVWAPRAKRVHLILYPDQERVPMRPTGGGWFSAEHPRIRGGQQYAFSLDGGDPVPDPRSQYQPHGVHGPSCWVDFEQFVWSDEGFQQPPLGAAVIYELHVGTFTQQGTFEAIIERLPHLVDLGITHVELMPVAHFPKTRGWGYDGVSLFAPHTNYGGPAGLAKLVDACHAAGLAVLLDVVYNHLGPSGNYLGKFGPYFTGRYHTPWGDALNFDDAGSHEVRRFICDNALHWLRHYHLDGLRLDAVHAIFDQSAVHILRQLAREVDQLSSEVGRHLVVTAESGLNDPRIVSAPPAGHGLHSQWSDDFHHALHTALTEEHDGYYVDYRGLEDLAQALQHGFVYRGQYSRYRDCHFGADTQGLRGKQFLVFSQNHDQIGNRAVGDRLSTILALGQLKLAAALTLLSPFVPLLFMGEEWGSRTPFQYFTDHEEPELAAAVRNGRREEFASFGWKADDVPDPQARSTFERSRLDWDELSGAGHRELLEWHRALLRLRREPSLADDRLETTRVDFDQTQGWLTLHRGDITVACNFSNASRRVPLDSSNVQPCLLSLPDVAVGQDGAVLPGYACAVLKRIS